MSKKKTTACRRAHKTEDTRLMQQGLRLATDAATSKFNATEAEESKSVRAEYGLSISTEVDGAGDKVEVKTGVDLSVKRTSTSACEGKKK